MLLLSYQRYLVKVSSVARLSQRAAEVTKKLVRQLVVVDEI
jgi:hypothetical protein